MASSVALKRFLASGILSRSLCPARPAACSASSRLFKTNAARDHDDEEDVCDRASHRSPFLRRCYAPSFGGVVDPFSPGISPILVKPFVDIPAGSAIRRPFDVKETDDDVQFRFDMPGLGKEDVKVRVEQNTLVVKGESQKESGDEGSARRFSTEIDIPEKLYKTDGIKAEMKNGVLKVSLPKVKNEERKDVFHVNIV